MPWIALLVRHRKALKGGGHHRTIMFGTVLRRQVKECQLRIQLDVARSCVDSHCAIHKQIFITVNAEFEKKTPNRDREVECGVLRKCCRFTSMIFRVGDAICLEERMNAFQKSDSALWRVGNHYSPRR